MMCEGEDIYREGWFSKDIYSITTVYHEILASENI